MRESEAARSFFSPECVGQKKTLPGPEGPGRARFDLAMDLFETIDVE